MQSFDAYLNDEIFVDYFNTFLSLPIFPRRFLYRTRRKKFEVDPPLRPCQVDKKILCTWISSERLPLFWKTDLFLDYLLCKLLITPVENTGRKQVSTMVDDKTLRKHIGHLIGMQQFRHYTKGTMGECILNFWCDTEKFRRHTPPELRRFVFRDIQYKYLKNGSAYEIPNTIKSRVYSDGDVGEKPLQNSPKDVSIFSEDCFITAQHLVVTDLYNYWVPKYILHKCHELATTYQQRRLSRAFVAKHLKEISPAKMNSEHGARDTEKEKRNEKRNNSLFESIDEDEEYENEKNIFFETCRVSSTESDDIGRKSRSPFLPDIKSPSVMSHGPLPESKKRGRSESLKLPALPANMASESGSETANRNWDRKPTRRFSLREFLKPTMPFAMLEDDVSAERRLKTESSSRNKKNKKGADSGADDDVIRAVDKASITNIMQTIKPMYYEDIPKKPLSVCQCRSVVLSKPESSDEQRLFLASVMADRFAGDPLRNYLKCSGNTTALACLQFWADAHTYVGVVNSGAADLKFRHGRNIMVTYLQPEAVREIQLEPSLRDKLCRLLRRGQADMLLMKVAEQIVELLFEPWKKFVEAEEENLHAVLELNSKGMVTFDEPGDSLKNSQRESFRMYRALDLALCLAQGDFQLMDVKEEEEEVTSESDDEEENDGSLRKRRLTIVNEEAAVALAVGVGETIDATNVRRKSHFYGKISRKSRKSSLFNSAAFKTRPPKPRKFHDMLTDSVQMLWLKRFLMEHDAIIPLKFWQDVEKMKTQSKDSRARQTKARVIVKSFFANIDDPCKNLQCRAEIIREIPRIDHVTPAMLVSAQACVIRSLEEEWFGRYLATFPEDAKEEDTTKYAARNTLLGVAKIASRGKTRGLWALFGHSVYTFVRGVNKEETRSSFMRFLVNESKVPVEGRKGVNNGLRRIINNRVIFVDRLINDLMFWLEIERFKSICDGASACALAGNYTIDDEKFIRSKARTILDCYIESTLPPKLQINITIELAETISHLWTAGIIDRGMFHDAQIYLFCILINYWKKFLAKDAHLAKGSEKKLKRRVQKKSEKQMLYLDDMPYRKLVLGPDEEPRISFSLSGGLRIIS